ncbi:MAG: hypothetical protein Q7T55_10740 [Solirubrobacteraceae bacterium]|nr:hypothetical protein [Solirubrobacteraceae bacterium]
MLELVGSEPGLVAAVWLRLPSQRELATKRAIRQAREAPYGIVVARGPATPTTTVAAALLSLHVAVLRGRTPAQWRTIDARRRNQNVNKTAAALDCTHQTVSRSLARSGLSTTNHTRSALVALLELAAAD